MVTVESVQKGIIKDHLKRDKKAAEKAAFTESEPVVTDKSEKGKTALWGVALLALVAGGTLFWYKVIRKNNVPQYEMV